MLTKACPPLEGASIDCICQETPSQHMHLHMQRILAIAGKKCVLSVHGFTHANNITYGKKGIISVCGHARSIHFGKKHMLSRGNRDLSSIILLFWLTNMRI